MRNRFLRKSVSEIIGVEAGYVRFQKFDTRGDDIRILYGTLNNVFDAVLGYFLSDSPSFSFTFQYRKNPSSFISNP